MFSTRRIGTAIVPRRVWRQTAPRPAVQAARLHQPASGEQLVLEHEEVQPSRRKQATASSALETIGSPRPLNDV